MTLSELVALLVKYGPTLLSDIENFESGKPITINGTEKGIVIQGVGTLTVSESVTITKTA